VHLAQAIKSVVKIPVITVGRVRTPELANRIVQEGKADLVSMGRALIADPHFPRKALEGDWKRLFLVSPATGAFRVSGKEEAFGVP